MLLDRPTDALAPPAAGVRAFLIADVRGYTRYTRERGDDAAARLAARFADLIREGLAGTDGELVDLRGDEAALAFGSVRQALRTALVLQDRFARERAADPTLPLGVGMGLDAGEAVAVAGGYRGMALNLAARLCAAASAGEVLVSEAVAHLAGPVEGLACLDRGPLTLKGLDGPVRALQALPTPFVAVVAAPTSHEARVGIERLLVDLRAAGVACWDTTALEETEGATGLRAGVRACRSVLLIGTPGTGQARLVTAAREVAGVYRRPVVTAWLDGTEGTDADNSADTPLAEREGTLDLRGARYATALPHLVGLLEQVEECVIAPLEATAPGGPIAMDPATQVASRNPYKGLRAFREDDTGDFFGRAALVTELVAAVGSYTRPGAARFLSVVGPSGSGKSSVVLAGLLPRLRRGALPGSERWVYLAPLVPGAHPLEALAVALNNALPGSSLGALHADLTASTRGLHLLASRVASTPDGRVVLVVDQAEELFTLTAGEDERRQVIDLLVAAASEPRGPLLVVLTLRADFYDRPLAYPALGRLMATQSTAVLPLGPAELRAAIEAPARLPDVGLRFQGDLVGDLLYEVRDQAGALPLLQFTLDQLYERREGHLLTEAAYRELGGVRGALGRQAEATYLGLPDDEDRGLARALFLRLIEPGVSAQDTTRRRATFRVRIGRRGADGAAAGGGGGIHRGAVANDGRDGRGTDAGGEPRGADPRVGATGRLAPGRARGRAAAGTPQRGRGGMGAARAAGGQPVPGDGAGRGSELGRTEHAERVGAGVPGHRRCGGRAAAGGGAGAAGARVGRGAAGGGSEPAGGDAAARPGRGPRRLPARRGRLDHPRAWQCNSCPGSGAAGRVRPTAGCDRAGCRGRAPASRAIG